MAHETTDTVAHTEANGHTAEHEPFYFEPAFWVAVAFAIFMFFAIKPLCRFIAKALDSRSAQISAELAEARRLREEAEQVLAAYQKRQRESLQEAETMMANTRADAEKIMAKAEAELSISLEKRLKLAMDKIAQSEAKAVQEMQGYVADVALSAARKLIEDTMNKGGNDELVRQATVEVAGKLH